jgi:predicted RecA/RadA family phage recombinase
MSDIKASAEYKGAKASVTIPAGSTGNVIRGIIGELEKAIQNEVRAKKRVKVEAKKVKAKKSED